MQWRRVLVGGMAAALLTSGATPGIAGADDAVTQDLIRALQQKVEELESRLSEQEAATGDVQRLEGEIVTLRDDVSTWRDVDVASGTDFNLSGYVETSYTYNFNEPQTPVVGGRGATNALRIFDTSDQSFNVDAVKLELENSADEVGDAGFRVDLLYGTQADLIDLDPNFGGGADDIEIMQAYVNYIADVGNGLEVKAGKFVTWIGYEVIETHANPNISRAYTFGLSIPFTHTGVGASYQFNDMVAYSQYLVNGWDNAVDSDNSKSTGGQLVLTPPEDMTFGYPTEFYFNWIFGDEGTPEGDAEMFVLDWIITTEINEQWSAALNVDIGGAEFEDASVPVGFGLPPTAFDEDEWFGIAAYLTYKHNDALSYVVRAEYWEEDEGTRTFLFTPDRLPGTKLDVFGLTGTVNYWLTDNLYTRAELRYDSASDDVFNDDRLGTFDDSQVTFGWNATYLF